MTSVLHIPLLVLGIIPNPSAGSEVLITSNFDL